MRRRPSGADHRGYSLVEVMVAVVVICAGLIGIAKMQALALSNTSTARLRSLAALEAASLAAAMHSNRQYWAGTPPTSIVVSSNPSPAPPTIVSSDAAMAATATADLGAAFPGRPQNCIGNAASGPVCPAPNLAAFDLAWWLSSLNALLPNPGATINCSNLAPAACTIQITWTESAVAMNSQQTNAPNAQQFQTPTYTLYVEP
jgi:type IV pilus assembly protein PilV